MPLNKNGEQVAIPCQAHDEADEEPRHLQEGRRTQEGHSRGEEVLQEAQEGRRLTGL